MTRQSNYKSNPGYQKTLAMAEYIFSHPNGCIKRQIVTGLNGKVSDGEFDEYEDILTDNLIVIRRDDIGMELGIIRIKGKLVATEVFVPYHDTTISHVRQFLKSYFSSKNENVKK